MINFLSSWVKNLSLALIIVSILEMILPNNKTKKYVKMIMGLYILFSIIAPFIENKEKINLDNINLNFYTEEIEETSSLEVKQESMDRRLEDIYKQELEKDIQQKIEEKGFLVEECKVEANISKDNNDNGIEKIILKVNKIEENEKENKQSLEEKVVTEIQKIQKIDISISEKNNNKEQDEQIKENTNITKSDIKNIKDFLKQEYGVREQCLKIS